MSNSSGFTYYEKFHLHGYVHHKDDHYNKKEMDSRLELYKNDIDNIKTGILTEAGDVLKLENNLKTVERSIRDIESDLAIAEGEIDHLETQTGNLKIDIGDLSVNLIFVETDIQTLSGRTGIVETSIESVEDDVGLLDGRIETIETMLSQPVGHVFYKGKCAHNNEQHVEFYKDTDGVNKGINVKHSDGDFSCATDRKLKIIKKGLYTIASNFRIKLNKIVHDVNINGFYVQKPLPSSSAWNTVYFNITLEIAENTELEIMWLDNSSGILDGKSYSRFSIFRLME